VRVIDFMPPRGHPPDVVRIVEGISGSVLIRSTLRLRFDYGHVVPWVRRHGDQVSYARAGDTVTVVALDRLGRSLSGIVQTVKTLGERGIVLRSLREGVDTSTSTGRMVLGIFASLAERTLIGERAAAAREAARIRGRQVGRPRALTGEQVAMTVRMRTAGESVGDICRTFGIGRSTLYRLWSTGPEIAGLDLAEVGKSTMKGPGTGKR